MSSFPFPIQTIDPLQSSRKKGSTRGQRKRSQRLRNEAAFKDPVIIESGDELLFLLVGKPGGAIEAQSRRKLRSHVLRTVINPALGRKSSVRSRIQLAGTLLRFLYSKKWAFLKETRDGVRLSISKLGLERVDELRAQRRQGGDSSRRAS